LLDEKSLSDVALPAAAPAPSVAMPLPRRQVA